MGYYLRQWDGWGRVFTTESSLEAELLVVLRRWAVDFRLAWLGALA